MERQEWVITEGLCGTPGAEGIPTYGVAVRHGDGTVWAWPDVDVDRAVVCRLAARLQAAQPARCHYEELVLDYLEEVAGMCE